MRYATGTAARQRLPTLVRSGVQDLRELAVDYAELAVADTRNAAVRLAWLLSAGVGAAVLAVTAWLALVAGALVWLLGTGMSWIAALCVAALVNIVAAVGLGLWIRGLLSAEPPPFAATLRQLRGERSSDGESLESR
jgi:hypothetical protein